MNFVTKIALRKRGRPPIGKVAMTNAERQRRYRAKQRRGVHFSSKSADWSTPQSLYDQLDSEFGFELDVCATAENAKCERFYSLADNGLAQPWTGTCFCNPP
jgi:DNA N-6-adenine-methyltransferase (Dam)